MLGKYDFVDAVARYAHNIKTIAARAGAPGKFNTTITVAFLSLIAERMGSGKYADYGDFISQNQDLESKGLLRRWYPSERLQSDLARKVFLLPSATR